MFEAVRSVLSDSQPGLTCSTEGTIYFSCSILLIFFHAVMLLCVVSELDEGLCCPLELTSVLTNSFKHADEKLLAWLEGKVATCRG